MVRLVLISLIPIIFIHCNKTKECNPKPSIHLDTAYVCIGGEDQIIFSKKDSANCDTIFGKVYLLPNDSVLNEIEKEHGIGRELVQYRSKGNYKLAKDSVWIMYYGDYKKAAIIQMRGKIISKDTIKAKTLILYEYAYGIIPSFEDIPYPDSCYIIENHVYVLKGE